MRKLARTVGIALGLSWVSVALGAAGPASAATDAAAKVSPTDADTAVAMSEDTDPAALRRRAIEQTYQARLIESLNASANPRDWALAAIMAPSTPGPAHPTERKALLARAAAAAPDDALVQWIAVLQSAAGDDASAQSAYLTNLKRIEPDNAAVWAQELARAMQRQDRVATDAALKQMATSKRADEHLFELLAALVRTYKHYPMSDDYFSAAATQTASASSPLMSREAFPYLMANAITMAAALPAYQ
jgi:hypothetical protein